MSGNRLIAAIIFGVLLAGGLVGAGALIGWGIVDARTGDRAVTVRGFSERIVKADLAILPLRFAESGDVLEEVQGRIDKDTDTVRRFLAAQGYRPGDVDLGRLEVTDQHAKEYQNQNAVARFIVAQTVIVRTSDVDRVQDTTRRLSDLVRQGVVLQEFRGPSYIYTRLNDARPEMIKEATASARSGAEQFARDSGAALAGIRSATQGSFEILARDQINEEGGQDQSIAKRLRVVTTVTYALR